MCKKADWVALKLVWKHDRLLIYKYGSCWVWEFAQDMQMEYFIMRTNEEISGGRKSSYKHGEKMPAKTFLLSFLEWNIPRMTPNRPNMKSFLDKKVRKSLSVSYTRACFFTKIPRKEFNILRLLDMMSYLILTFATVMFSSLVFQNFSWEFKNFSLSFYMKFLNAHKQGNSNVKEFRNSCPRWEFLIP